MEVWLYKFLTSSIDGGDWSASGTEPFTDGERAPGTKWIRGSVGLRAGLDAVAKRNFPVQPVA